MKYFDYASTTPVDPEILETYQQVLSRYYANSESLYPSGIEVNKLMNKSRQQVADLLGVKADEIIFTSSGSEANNLAVKGICLARQQIGRHIITSKIEHSSVLNSCHWLEDYMGYEVTYLNVNPKGEYDLDQLKKSLREDTVLVSLMWVNNETGTVEHIDEIIDIVRKFHNCYLHIDCVQALGKLPLNFRFIDTASFSAHKIYGLKGSGILMKKQSIEMTPVISGGQQEFGLRGGTANAPENIVFAKTLRKALEKQEENLVKVQGFNDYLRQEIGNLDHVVINSPADCSPYVLNFSCLTITSEVMMNALSLKGYCVSAQSTCESTQAHSYVLAAMFADRNRLTGSIRLSLSAHQSMADMEALVADLKEIIEQYG